MPQNKTKQNPIVANIKLTQLVFGYNLESIRIRVYI